MTKLARNEKPKCNHTRSAHPFVSCGAVISKVSDSWNWAVSAIFRYLTLKMTFQLNSCFDNEFE